MDADRRRRRVVPYIVRMILAKGTRMIGRDLPRLLADAMLLQYPGSHGESSGRSAMIMESRRLSRQPADHPQVVVGPAEQPLIPTLIVAQPDAFDPLFGRSKL